MAFMFINPGNAYRLPLKSMKLPERKSGINSPQDFIDETVRSSTILKTRTQLQHVECRSNQPVFHRLHKLSAL